MKVGFDIPIAAQRLCCGPTVLLGGASHKVRLSLSVRISLIHTDVLCFTDADSGSSYF